MRELRGGRARGRVGRWRPQPPVGYLGRGMISAWRPCSATTPTSVASWMWPARWLCTLSSIGPTSGCVRTRRTRGRRGGEGAGGAGLGWAGGGRDPGGGRSARSTVRWGKTDPEGVAGAAASPALVSRPEDRSARAAEGRAEPRASLMGRSQGQKSRAGTHLRARSLREIKRNWECMGRSRL